MSITTTASDDDDPKKLPGYDLLTALAQNGVSIYYRARKRSLDQVVALYTVPSADTAIQRRLEHEAGLLASLRHPHVVQILDRFEHRGRVYLALEAVDGGSLDQRIRGSAQPCRASAGLVGCLARTIAYVHDRGILHCDLKSSRILLAVPPATEMVSDPDAAVYKTSSASPSSAAMNSRCGAMKFESYPRAPFVERPRTSLPNKPKGACATSDRRRTSTAWEPFSMSF